MCPVDLIVQEALSVLPQVQVGQPVRHVILGPVRQGLGGEGLGGGRGWQMGIAEAGRWRDGV